MVRIRPAGGVSSMVLRRAPAILICALRLGHSWERPPPSSTAQKHVESCNMMHAAVVGLGRWGRAIVEAAQGRSTRVRFVLGVGKEPEASRDFADRHGLRLTSPFQEALKDPRVDAVFLATPHSLHVGQAIAAARARKPVRCEKPLALTRAEAARAVDACRQAGVVLGSSTNKLCFASMRELKRVVDSGVLGEILHIEGHSSNENSTRVAAGGWRDDPRESP